ncbi:MAG TPA: L,D-transpeptidase family protein [Solirubrobacteraceae bacterium]
MNEPPTQFPDPRRRWPTTLLALSAASIAIGPIAAGQLLPAGGPGVASAGSRFTPVQEQRAATTPVSRSIPRSGALVALLTHATTMRATAGGIRLGPVPTRTGFGSPQALWVVAQRGGWLGVISSLAGNNRVGWIPRSSSSLGVVSWELRVSLSRRALTVIDSGRVVRRITVAIGRPGAPTPTGRFAVTDRLLTAAPAGPYGCCILALSAHSPHAIQGWTGGDRIAIHSTPDAASIGQPVSHGCVRVTVSEGRWLMSHIPLGTPTLITS